MSPTSSKLSFPQHNTSAVDIILTTSKTGGEVPEMRRRIFLHIKDVEDLSRDILKSETDKAEDGSGIDDV